MKIMDKMVNREQATQILVALGDNEFGADTIIDAIFGEDTIEISLEWLLKSAEDTWDR